jgi:WD40 repeat protein
MLRRWLTRFPRAILVLLLVPLLGAVIWQTVRFAPKHVIDLAFSADGRHLLISFIKRNDLKPAIEASNVVETWDLESGQLVDSQRFGQGTILFTSNAENFINCAHTGHIRLLRPGTNRPLKEWHLPEKFGTVWRVLSNGHLAIVHSTTNGDTRYVTCLNSEGAHALVKAPSAFTMLSGDQSRLFVSYFDRQAGTQTTDVYQISRESLTKLEKLSFNGWPIATDSSGNVVYRSGPAGNSLLDLRTSKSCVWRPPPGKIRPTATFFTEQGRYFHAVFAEGLSATYDATTSKLVSTRQLTHCSRYVKWPYAVSRDRRMLAWRTDDRHVAVWDLTSGAAVARFPDSRADRAGPVCFALCLIVCCAWCFLWVIRGVHVKQTHPWLDMIVVNGLLLVVLTIHVAARSAEAIHPTMFAAYLALLVALTAALCVWWIYGQGRWSLRLTGLLTGLAIIVAALLGTGHQHDRVIWTILLGSVSYVVTLALLLGWWRWRGLTLTDAETAATGCGQPRGSRWQLPLSDLLLVTAAIAVLLAVTRFVLAFPLGIHLVAHLAAFGVGLAMTTFVAIWAALARRHMVVRLTLLVVVAAVSGALPWLLWLLTGILYAKHARDWWPTMVCGFAALAVLLSFSIFRLHGYHLFRRARHALSENTNTSPTR